MKVRCAVLLAALALVCGKLVAGPIAVPIYIEDNHAGSFYWLAEHLDLDEPCTLLHFDAHSDASGIFDSDLIRRQVRRVASHADRKDLLERWRSKGAIQCFNWIEPLMPAPIAEVIWVPGDHLDDPTKAQHLADDAGNLLDGHLEAAPRATGALRPRMSVMGLDQLRAQIPKARPVIATIDLDYFSGFSPNDRSAALEKIWSFITELRNLRAITIAVSRPYLESDEEADALVKLALRASLSLPTAKIQFEPFQDVAHDRSTRANEYRAQKRAIPRYDVTRASPALRAMLLGNAGRISVQKDAARWQDLLRQWSAEAPTFNVALEDHQPSTDNVWRLPATEAGGIELTVEPWYSPVGNVRWIAQVPRYPRCNLIATSDTEIGFAEGAPPRPRWEEIELRGTATKLPLDSLRQLFDEETGCGAVRVRAVVENPDWIRETPTIEIRRFSGTGFRAAVMEQFGLPYLFGSGALRSNEDIGPETGWGADCSNFLIYALRRQGARIPWSNPRQFRNYLEPIAQGVGLQNRPLFSAEELERGIILHLGTHVAALMEDRPPLGVLDAGDIVAHQLEGVPALISVADLLRSREKTTFDLLRVPPPSRASDLIIGGDVMLGRSIGRQIQAGADPFAGIRDLLQRAGTAAVNLECVVSDKGAADSSQKFHLRAPLEAADTISAAGIDVIGLANNHSADFGRDALSDSIRRLRAAGPMVVSGLQDHADVVTRTGRVRFVAINDVDNNRSPAERTELSRTIGKAKAEAEFVVALVHWGEENTAVVTERQRALARRLIDQGVDLIAGSHPHCIQPLDFYHGRPIAYSLGNLVFDGAPTVASWNKGLLLKVGLGNRNVPTSLELLPVRFDSRGFPQMTTRTELTLR